MGIDRGEPVLPVFFKSLALLAVLCVPVSYNIYHMDSYVGEIENVRSRPHYGANTGIITYE